FLTAGLNDPDHLPRFGALIARNRVYQALPGGPDVRFGLLADEVAYLRKTGRVADAQRSEQELQRMVEERRAAAARLGIRE
ncbi:MAG TPA: hypothetical protein VJ853_13940, partial [Thermoanaerobaculia bacterium]|nr:hypothetical protein [Thermoanaerobaculia bacterium]